MHHVAPLHGLSSLCIQMWDGAQLVPDIELSECIKGIWDACCLWLRTAPFLLRWGLIAPRTVLTGAGGEAEYMVALQQTIVQASELQMAPEFEPGQRVEFHDSDGQILDASVVQIDASHW